MNEIEHQLAEERVSASVVQEDNISTSEDLDIPTATAAEDPHPEAIESDSPLESISPSAQSESDQGNANEQTSSNEGEISLEPETPETKEAQLEDAPATPDVLNSTGENPIDDPSYEDDYAGDADQPREDASSEAESHVEEDSAAIDPIGAMEETSDAIDSDRENADRDESGVQDVDNKQALAEVILEPEAQASQANSSRNIESETSAPVEEAVGADSIAEEVANPNAADVEAPQQQESEEATSADDQQGGDEATADDSSFIDPSGMAEAEVGHIDGTPSVTTSDDEAESAVPQREKEDKGVTPGEPGVDDEKDESIESERDAAGAVALENGNVQDHVHATEFPPDENEGIGKEVDSVDVDAVPETTTALPTEGEEGQSDTVEPGTSNGSSSAHETEAPLEEAPASEELSKESETQQSAPGFASYDDFEDQGGPETSPPPVDEPTSALEADVVDNDGVTESSRVAAGDVVNEANQSESPKVVASAGESEPPQIVKDTADSGGDYEQETEQELVEKSELSPSIEPDSLPSEAGTESAEPPAMPSDETLEAENGDLSTEPAASVDEEAPQIGDQADSAVGNTELSGPDVVESDSTLTETEQPMSEELQKVVVDNAAPEASVSLDTEDEVAPPVDADEPVIEKNVEQLSSALSCDPGETIDPEVVHPAEIGASGAAEREPELADTVSADEPTLQVAAESQPEAESPKMDEYEDFETEAKAPIAVATVEADTNDAVVKEGAEQVQPVSNGESLATIDPEIARPVENVAFGDADGEAKQFEAETTESTLLVPAEQHPEAEETASPKIDEYDDFEAEAEAVVAEIAVDKSPVTPPAPESADAYDDFEADAEPTIQVQPVSDDDAARDTPAMGSASPGSDLYDEFEGDDDAASPAQVSSPPPVEKGVEPLERIPNPTESASINDEDEYAEEAEYNDFEDEQEAEKKPLSAIEQISSRSILSTGSTPREVEEDEEPPSATPAISAKPKDAGEYDDEDYAVEGDFEDDEKPSGTLPKQNGATVTTTPTATAKPPQYDAENEYEADYDAEYDDFDE